GGPKSEPEQRQVTPPTRMQPPARPDVGRGPPPGGPKGEPPRETGRRDGGPGRGRVGPPGDRGPGRDSDDRSRFGSADRRERPQRTGPRRLDDVKKGRVERVEGGKRVIEEPGNRVIIRDQGRMVIRRDEV